MNAALVEDELVPNFFSSVLGAKPKDQKVSALVNLAKQAYRDKEAATKLKQWLEGQWPSISQRLQSTPPPEPKR